jgi:hypothetical protein
LSEQQGGIYPKKTKVPVVVHPGAAGLSAFKELPSEGALFPN